MLLELLDNLLELQAEKNTEKMNTTNKNFCIKNPSKKICKSAFCKTSYLVEKNEAEKQTCKKLRRNFIYFLKNFFAAQTIV